MQIGKKCGSIALPGFPKQERLVYLVIGKLIPTRSLFFITQPLVKVIFLPPLPHLIEDGSTLTDRQKLNYRKANGPVPNPHQDL